jgi:hypothetical protein
VLGRDADRLPTLRETDMQEDRRRAFVNLTAEAAVSLADTADRVPTTEMMWVHSNAERDTLAGAFTKNGNVFQPE